jgi:DNA-binding response OmpR family regulator
MQILLIEDTIPLAQTIIRYLGHEDITCTLRTDGQSGYQEALDRAYDVIILDISLPLMDGITLCQRLREAHRDTPILMLTSRNTREDIILGLDAGADDYLAKPCDYRELLARVRALSRRGMSEKSTSQIQFGNMSIDDTQKIVQYQ